MYEEYRDTHVLYTSSCDMRGWWKLSSVLDTMQTIADQQNEILKYGRASLKKAGLTWVLFRTLVEMTRYPRIGERVTVRTYSKAPCMHFIPRFYELTDEMGHVLSRAGSFWALLDVKTKKTVLPKDKSVVFPDNRDKPSLVNLLRSPVKVKGEKMVSEYVPLYCDFDVNGHVNNIRYVDWLYNAIGLEELQEKAVGSAIIEYKRETLPGHTLRNSITRSGSLFCFEGDENDKSIFSITGTLKDRIDLNI